MVDSEPNEVPATDPEINMPEHVDLELPTEALDYVGQTQGHIDFDPREYVHAYAWLILGVKSNVDLLNTIYGSGLKFDHFWASLLLEQSKRLLKVATEIEAHASE